MLAIRLQRLGRKGYPTYRLAVQEAQRHPQSGKVVSYIGHYNPHSKEVKLDAEKLDFYLKNGAQPTSRVVQLLKAEKVKLPKWVAEIDNKKKAGIKNLEKLRKNRPAEAPKAEDKPAEDAPTEPADEQPAPEAEAAASEAPAAEDDKPAEETPVPTSDEKA